MILRVLQCDGCCRLLSGDDGVPYVESGDELEWRARNRLWQPDYNCVPTKWYCITCKMAVARNSLVTPALPTAKPKRRRATRKDGAA